jgi:cytochrome c553
VVKNSLALILLLVAFAPPVQSAQPGDMVARPDNAVEVPLQPPAVAPDSAHGRILFLKHCVECHGRRGWGDGPREIPGVAGQREPYIIEQLTRFANGERAGSAMHGPAMYETLRPDDVDRPQAIRELAAYLSRAAPNPDPDHGDGQALALGKRIYSTGCAACHGADAAGSDSGVLPRLAGQHYLYLLEQLRSFAVVHHLPSDPVDVASLTAEERQALADYLSRLNDGAGAQSR